MKRPPDASFEAGFDAGVRACMAALNRRAKEYDLLARSAAKDRASFGFVAHTLRTELRGLATEIDVPMSKGAVDDVRIYVDAGDSLTEPQTIICQQGERDRWVRVDSRRLFEMLCNVGLRLKWTWPKS